MDISQISLPDVYISQYLHECTRLHWTPYLSSTREYILHTYIFHVIEPYLNFEIFDRNMPSIYHTHFCLLIKAMFYSYPYLDNLEP